MTRGKIIKILNLFFLRRVIVFVEKKTHFRKQFWLTEIDILHVALIMCYTAKGIQKKSSWYKVLQHKISKTHYLPDTDWRRLHGLLLLRDLHV